MWRYGRSKVVMEQRNIVIKNQEAIYFIVGGQTVFRNYCWFFSCFGSFLKINLSRCFKEGIIVNMQKIINVTKTYAYIFICGVKLSLPVYSLFMVDSRIRCIHEQTLNVHIHVQEFIAHDKQVWQTIWHLSCRWICELVLNIYRVHHTYRILIYPMIRGTSLTILHTVWSNKNASLLLGLIFHKLINICEKWFHNNN